MRIRVWMVLLLAVVLTGCSVTVPESINNKISQTKDSVMEKVESSKDTLLEKAEQATDSLGNAIDNTLGEDIGDDVMGKVDELTESAEDKLDQVTGGNSDTAEDTDTEDNSGTEDNSDTADDTNEEGSASELSSEDFSDSEYVEVPCTINFVYHNSFYGYDLEASWKDVPVRKNSTNLGSEIYGLEILFDGTTQALEELDMDGSGDISAQEWGDIDEDFPMDQYDSDEDGVLSESEILGFSQVIGGIDVYPDSFTITQPTMEGYAIDMEEDGPVSIKILRASTGGYTGPYQTYFAAGTVFVELSADFDLYMPEAYGMETTIAFDYPLLSMYLTDGKEVIDSYSHGALGFTSIVDTNEFNDIFEGETFWLQYDAYYDGHVVGTYDLSIMPMY